MTSEANEGEYQTARSVECALEELQRCAGSQFDPELVTLFIDLLRGDPHFHERLAGLRTARGPLDLGAT